MKDGLFLSGIVIAIVGTVLKRVEILGIGTLIAFFALRVIP